MGFGNYGVNEICNAKQKILLEVYKVYNFECQAEGLITVGKELTSVLKVIAYLKMTALGEAVMTK